MVEYQLFTSVSFKLYKALSSSNVVGFESTVSYEIETVKGLGNIFLGGEGLFLTKLVGPGRVIIQSQNFGDFAGKILGMMPKNNR